MKLKPLRGNVLVTRMERGIRKLASGIVLPNDDGRDTGIRPRWARVYAVGEEVPDITAGDWALIAHGRWSRALTLRDGDDEITVYQVDWRTGILATQSEPPDLEFG